MIDITVYRKHNQITAFKLSGHAESGPYGYDLVCAGVSAVTFGAVNAVMKLCEIDLPIEQGKHGGFLHVMIPEEIDKLSRERASFLFEGMVVSLETIEREYNQFIKIQSK